LQLRHLGPEGLLLALRGGQVGLLLVHGRDLGEQQHDHGQQRHAGRGEPDEQRCPPAVHSCPPGTVALAERSTEDENVHTGVLFTADEVAELTQALTHPLTCSSRVSHRASVSVSNASPDTWMFPIRVDPGVVGTPGAAWTGAAIDPVNVVIHIRSGITRDRSCRTPDQDTVLARACDSSVSSVWSCVRRVAKCWSSLTCCCSCALVAFCAASSLFSRFSVNPWST